MKFYSVLHIGEYHLNHCDDYLIIEDIGTQILLCAIMDGCTMAPDSYFASTLVGKLLKKIAKNHAYKELYATAPTPDIETLLKTVMEELFQELTIVKNQLILDRNDLLTTLILLLVDEQLQEGIILVVGDGLVSINGKITEFDQDNKPDYLGFHLGKDFSAWYNSQKQLLHFHELRDISIASDGITLFKTLNPVPNPEPIDPIDFLIRDSKGRESEDMLELKLKKLEHVHGIKPTDDLSIVRLIFTDHDTV